MRKIVCSLLIIVLTTCIMSVTNAYSSTEFKIDVPSTYTEETENNFKNEDGTTISIKKTEENSLAEINYTEEELKFITDRIEKSFDEYKEKIKAEIKEKQGDSVSDEKIEEVLKDIKWNIEKKEIIDITKNNYKCFHIVSNISTGETSYYTDQYSIASGNTFYTITISVTEKEELESQEIKNILDSFTIINYKAHKGKQSTSHNKMSSIVIVIVVMIIGAILGAINRKRMGK